MLRLNPVLFNFILSLYIFFMNYFSMLNFLSSKINDYVFLLISYAIFFLLIFLAINILCFFRFFAYFFYVLLVISTGFAMYFVSTYGVVIDTIMIHSLFATDIKEANDFLSWHFFVFIFLSVVLPLILLKFLRIKANCKKSQLLMILINTIALAGILFASSKTLIPFLRANDIIRYYNVPFYQFYSSYKLAKMYFTPKKELQKISLDAKMNDDNVSKTFILVVGETARAKNYSLGGYTKNDTNFYTKDLGVHYFSNFSSCGTATAQSLPCMFSIHNRVDFSKTENYENVLSVLNRFIDVHWLDNNTGGCKGVCNGIKSIIKAKDYDGWLVDSASELLANKKDKNTLIIVHLQGSHGPSYYLRYPKEFEKFKPICNTNKLQECSEEALYNTYDNTLLYTDYLISKLIKLLEKDNADKKALFYLSDHGESLGENGFYLHGMPYYLAPKEQIQIPAILWMNYEYVNKNKLAFDLSQDNLFSTLLGFFNISTKDYKNNYDLFNDNLENNL